MTPRIGFYSFSGAAQFQRTYSSNIHIIFVDLQSLQFILYFEVDFYDCDIEFQYHGRGYSELTEYFKKKF